MFILTFVLSTGEKYFVFFYFFAFPVLFYSEKNHLKNDKKRWIVKTVVYYAQSLNFLCVCMHSHTLFTLISNLSFLAYIRIDIVIWAQRYE